MKVLIERLPSSLEGRLIERSKRKLLPGKSTAPVDVRLRSSYLLIDPVVDGSKNLESNLPKHISKQSVSADNPLKEDKGEILRRNSIEFSPKVRVINLEGAVVRDVSGQIKAKKGLPAYAFEVAYVSEKKQDKIKKVVLMCQSEEELQRWMRHIDRLSIKSPPKRADFEPLLLLGAGHFGKVTLVSHKATGTVLALKEMREESVAAARAEAQRRRDQKKHGKSKTDSSPKGIGQLKLEKQITERLLLGQLVDNRWVGRLAFAFRERGKLLLAQEFAARGDLWSLIRAKKRLSLDATTQIAAELVSAVGSLHAHGIMHRDIKLENIMLDIDGHIKLIDFGLSKQLTPRPSPRNERNRYGFTFSLCGTRYYMSPEQIRGTGHNLSTDWWQVGCLIFELIVGKPAFYDKNTAKIDEKILSDEGANFAQFRKLAGDDADAALASQFIESLLIPESNDRLGANGVEEVKKHPYLESFNWSKVDIRQGPVDKEIAQYVDSGKDAHVVDSEVVAKYFRDAKTLDGEKLNEHLDTPLKTSSSSDDDERPPRCAHEGTRFTMDPARSSSSSTTPTRLEKIPSSDSVSTMGTTNSSSTFSSRAVKPTPPRRTESRGPLLGFNFAVPVDTLVDMSQGLIAS
mmetsp:Transcript_20732/g.36224  ORF Transcript_20732/g.36224 Transcript_20732/m.36224 type:complete len:630 (+) Transcript_20732:246-2135(+)|eukprot:CAMPEP_0171493300 /NCGR_PEP_ID=MMETSP0958-20121227/4888_1 /TAXON_ID=87120 /ORGANISM="Aurantiochytrium limacinum, Strain ATCCMYA-1381" /LENGTH=629 /DNA_ID=CAMNT_0012026913 /DNA_START=175 /DNA_END=2064 /DNA_ORIENTATION=+